MIINADTPASEEKVRKVEGRTLREVTVKIGLERIDTQEGVTVEALLDSGAMGLVMSSEFARKQGFKLKKLERPMNIRNVDGSLNKEKPIENTVEVNIYYQGHRERTEIDVIGGQKWTVILEMPWLACHNSEIDWRMGEVKMMRCLEECGKQWRPVQGKSEWEEQKEEEAKEEAERKREKKKKKKQKKGKTVEVKKVAEEWEIWDEEEEVVKSEAEAKKLVPEKFHEWIKGVWEEAVGKNANKKIVRSCNICEGRVCTTKRKDIPVVEREKREDKRICEGVVEEGVYLAIKVTANGTSIFCGEEGWEEKDGARLQVFK